METSFILQPSGPFDLLHQNQYFNGWPTMASDDKTIVLAFPVEGWSESVAVTLRQDDNGALHGKVYGLRDHAGFEQAKNQALACMSLDVDGNGWSDVGQRDGFMRKLQKSYKYLRPTLFHSPYEAAAGFLIGHRISIAQARKIRTAMARDLGSRIDVDGETCYAFPQPQHLLEVDSYPALNEVKISRLHAVCEAALEGWLERGNLRLLEPDQAIRRLETLPGVGPFFSEGILYRGVGLADGITSDDVTRYAIIKNYHLAKDASLQEIHKIAEQWHPYRMWATVLLHVWQRQNNDLPPRTFSR